MPLMDIVKEEGVNLVCIPVLFAKLLESSGTLGPAEIPQKRAWLWKDIIRISNKQGVELKGPPFHPFNPLLALRVTTAVKDESTKQKVIKGLLDACWKDSRDISDQNVVIDVLNACQLDPFEILNESKTDRVKNLLRENTDHSISQGVFGVPSFQVDQEIYWGQDRLSFVQDHLRGNDPLSDPTKQQLFRELLNRPRGADRSHIKARM